MGNHYSSIEIPLLSYFLWRILKRNRSGLSFKEVLSLMPSNYGVPILESAFRVLESFHRTDEELSLRELSVRAEIPSTSAFRILFTLDKLGYISKNPTTRRYQLGLKIREIARIALPGRDLVQIARPFLTQLLDAFDETVNLAVLRNGEIIYVQTLESNHAFRMAAEVGSRAPVHSSALGKSIAAFLPKASLQALLNSNKLVQFTPRTITNRSHFIKALAKIRGCGYSFDNEETEIGATCVASPILNSYVHAVAAVSVAGPTYRIRAERQRIVRAVKKAAAAISELTNKGTDALSPSQIGRTAQMP